MRISRYLIGTFVLLLPIIFGSGCTGNQQENTRSKVTNINAEMVPEKLRPLIPLAEKWGQGDDGDREDVTSAATPAERAELRSALARYGDDITAWLDSFGDGRDMPDEAAAFMYMQLAAEEFDIP
jgi:hypothetical protein